MIRVPQVLRAISARTATHTSELSYKRALAILPPRKRSWPRKKPVATVAQWLTSLINWAATQAQSSTKRSKTSPLIRRKSQLFLPLTNENASNEDLFAKMEGLIFTDYQYYIFIE